MDICLSLTGGVASLNHRLQTCGATGIGGKFERFMAAQSLTPEQDQHIKKAWL